MRTNIIPGPFEAGLRALLILESLHPRACLDTELSLFDHVVVHTADFGGPPSLHPAKPGRAGEVAAREGLIRDGLALMARLGLVEETPSPEGLRYVASDDAYSFLETLSAGYTDAIRRRGEWLAERYRGLDAREAGTLVAELKARPFPDWVPIPDGEDAASRRAQASRFRELDADYACDLGRLSSVIEAAALASAIRIGQSGRRSPQDPTDPLVEELVRIEERGEAEASKVRRDRAGLAGLIADLEAGGGAG